MMNDALPSFRSMHLTPESGWDAFPMIDPPDEISIPLFPHQRVSVYWMEALESTRCVRVNETTELLTEFGVLGDMPGYGKSLSIATLMARDRMPWDLNARPVKEVQAEVNQCLTVRRRLQQPQTQRVTSNLLVVSSTLIEQWKQYLGLVKKPGFVVKEVSAAAHFEHLDPVNVHYDVVLVSSTRYNQLIDQFPNLVWKRFLFDEAASTHINAMRTVKAGFMWFISATYHELINLGGNRHHMMWRFMANVTRDNHLDHLVIRNPEGFVQRSFRMPDVTHHTHRCLNPRVMNVLSQFLDAESREMMSAGDIRGVIERVGGSMVSDSNLYEVVARRLQQRLNNAEFSLRMWTDRGRERNLHEIEFWTKRVESIQKSIAELKEKYKNVLEEDCTICYCPITRPVLVPCCQNVFCTGCVVKWMENRKTCPMCRTDLAVKDFVYVQSEEDAKDDDGDRKDDEKVDAPARPRQKSEVVGRLIEEGIPQGRKFLVFSAYDASFDRIRSVLAEHHIPYVEISGTKASRDAKLRRFREGKVSVVFLNSRFNGAGINLEMATDIILYHEMPSHIHQQVVGRVLRVGRQSDLRIHQLVFAD